MINMIVCMDKGDGIGVNGGLLYHLKGDLKHFRQKTLGTTIIMGRKTFESIGRPLPKRINIVLSRQPFEHEGVIWKNSFESAVNFVNDCDEIMLIGGGELFKQYLPKADKLYLTQIQSEIEGDTFFPTLDWNEWIVEFEEYRQADEDNEYDCRFLILVRSEK